VSPAQSSLTLTSQVRNRYTGAASPRPEFARRALRRKPGWGPPRRRGLMAAKMRLACEPRVWLALLMAGASLACGDGGGEAASPLCSADSECPAGAVCSGGICLPGEYTPLPQRDLGTPEDDLGTPQDLGGPVDLSVPDDQGPGADLEPDPDQGGLGPELRPLELEWLAPEEGARGAGELALHFRVAGDPRTPPRIFTLFVDGEPALRLGRPTPGAELVAVLATTEFADGHHTLFASLNDDAGREVSASERRLLFVNQPDRLGVEDGRFWADGEALALVGVDYVPPLNEAVLQSDLQALALAGVNLVAVRAPALEVEPEENAFLAEGCEAVTGLLARAREHGVWVMLRAAPAEAYPWLPRQAGVVAGPSAPFWDAKLRSAWARRIANLVDRCGWAESDALAAVQLWEAPSPGPLAARSAPLALAAWDAWSLERYGDAAARAAAWGEPDAFDCGPEGGAPCPPTDELLCGEGPATPRSVDYRAFLEDRASSALAALSATVAGSAPAALRTASFAAASDRPPAVASGACLAAGPSVLRAGSSAGLDFLLVSGQPWEGVAALPGAEGLSEEQAARQADFARFELAALLVRQAGLPLLYDGFSGDAALGGEQGPAIQAGLWQSVLESAVALRLAGVVGASWRDSEGGSATGLMGPDGQPRPAYGVLQAGGAAFAATAADPWAAATWLALPWDRWANPAIAVEATLPTWDALRPGAAGSTGASPCSLLPGLSAEQVQGYAELCGP